MKDPVLEYPAQPDLFTQQRIDESIQHLKDNCPVEGYYLAFSGGKDSICLKHLADLAGVKYDIHFHKTVDPPELLKYIKTYHSEVAIETPATSMFRLIIDQGIPPTRRMRFCCRVLKEEYGAGRVVLTGVRRDESHSRHGRKLVHICPSQGKIIINPMLEWSDVDVWTFIHSEGLPYCSLYDEGWKRIGCVGCPNAYWKTRIKEFQRWPKFYRAFLRCFDEMLRERKRNEAKSKRKTTWTCAQEVMNWWLEESKWTHKPDLPFTKGGGK